MKLDPIESVIEDIRVGKPIVMIDDANRENEGDLTVAAERINAENLGFMMREGKGLICLSLTEEIMERIGLPLQVSENRSSFGTNFAVSFDARAVGRTGITAAGRANSIHAAISDTAQPADFVQPGYVVPVCAVPGGVLRRRGQTEGSVDICRLAGLKSAGVICEIMNAQGEMLRGAELEAYCARHTLKITSVEELCQYRLRHEVSVRRIEEFHVPREFGLGRSRELDQLFRNSPIESVRVYAYRDDVEEKEHLAFVIGYPKDGCLVRIHSECLTGDVFTSRRCDCGSQLDQALTQVLSAGEGVIVYLHQEGRGIGLGNKLRAYELQDRGLDTVDANVHLGFAVDSRNYRTGAQILADLGIHSVRLLTNNPEKVRSIESFGITVEERVSLPVSFDEWNRTYLLTKRDRLGHLL